MKIFFFFLLFIYLQVFPQNLSKSSISQLSAESENKSSYEQNLNEYTIFIWDGEKWINHQKIFFCYSGKKVTKKLIKNWNGIKWINFVQIERSYDCENLVEELYQEWIDNKWIDYWKSIYRYKNNKIVEKIYRKGSKNLQNYNRWTYKYDGSMQLTDEIYQCWHTSKWINLLKTHHKYYSNNKLYEQTTQKWNSFKWEPDGRKTFTYYKNGNIKSIVQQYYCSESWKNNYKYNYEYDQNERLIFREVHQWQNDDWTNYFRCRYDLDLFMSERITQLWKGSSWVNCWYWCEVYNEFNKVIEEVSKEWTNIGWRQCDRYLYHYDRSQNKLDEIYQVWNGKQWVMKQKIGYDYLIPANIIDNDPIEYVIKLNQNYPNPFNHFTNIEFRNKKRSPIRLKICNLLGQEVKILMNEIIDPGTHSVSFNGSDLSSGIYTCILESEGSVEAMKMLLIK